MDGELLLLEHEIGGCERCPRLVRWCRRVASEKVARFREEPYWGKPVPAFGAVRARILLVGLAPGAHGANRTGRPFTGDGAGPFLFAALHRAGLASGPSSRSRDDGLQLYGARITNAVRCAPPGNRPTRIEEQRCAPYLVRELAALPQVRVIVALGAFAWNAVLRAEAAGGLVLPRPRPRFGHGAEFELSEGTRRLLGAFHPSQQNTRTGRLTPAMLDTVLRRAAAIARPGRPTNSTAGRP